MATFIIDKTKNIPDPKYKWYTVKDGQGNMSAGNTYYYGPYNSKSAAINVIKEVLGSYPEDLPVGWTCGIVSDGKIKEYWIDHELTAAPTESDLTEKGGSLNQFKIVDSDGNAITGQITLRLEETT